MTTGRGERPARMYRFDPHGGHGGVAGIGLARTLLVGGVLAVAVAAVYAGRVIPAAVLLVVVLPVAAAMWEGMPLVVWAALRLAYRLAGPRRWEVDPELVAMSDPFTTRQEGT